jgi:N-acetylneuraminic acid mutarotase
VLRSLGTGARFNLVTSTWTPISTNNAPTPRQNHTAMWTGTEMIIWGGFVQPSVTVLNTGGRYNPATDTWRETEPVGAPQARTGHTAVWTGDEMIIWGGVSTNRGPSDVTRYLNTGGRYDPLRDSWTTMSSAGGPSAYTNHAAVWAGKEMIVWGGGVTNTNSQLRLFSSSARYDPAMNTWKAVSTNGMPRADILRPRNAIWTGDEMIVSSSSSLRRGRYRPDTDTWLPISSIDAPGLTRAIVWTGKELVVWDGQVVGRYNPSTDTWTRRKLPGSPADVTAATAVWTGDSMVIFGGSRPLTQIYPNDVYAYSLTRPMYLYQKP